MQAPQNTHFSRSKFGAPSRLRVIACAGEPLNPEVIQQVQDGLGIVIRDGFGQTETTAQVGNSPGQDVVPGSMGRVLPGYEVILLDPATGQERLGDGAEGELCLRLTGTSGRPVGLMAGYHGDPERTYLTGLSLGGYGAWELARLHPHRWAAVAIASSAPTKGTLAAILTTASRVAPTSP